MSHATKVELIQARFEYFAETGELDWRVIDPDVEWHSDEDVPYSGIRRGHEAIVGLVGPGPNRLTTSASSPRTSSTRARTLLYPHDTRAHPWHRPRGRPRGGLCIQGPRRHDRRGPRLPDARPGPQSGGG